MSKTFEFEDIFQGKPLGEQARGAMFELPGIKANGVHRVSIRTQPGGDRVIRRKTGDGSPVSVNNLASGDYVLTVKDEDDNTLWVDFTVPTTRDVTFVFAWRSGEYAIQCYDQRD